MPLSLSDGNLLHLYSIFLGSPVEIRVVGMMERCTMAEAFPYLMRSGLADADA
jgi:hypothetical protein